MEPRVVAVRPQKPRWDLDQSAGEVAGHVVALRQRLAARLLRDEDPLGRDGDDLGRHAAERQDDQELLKQPPVVAEPGLGPQERLAPALEPELAPDPLLLARPVELVDRALAGRLERPRLDADPDLPQARVRLLERVSLRLAEPEVGERAQRQEGPEPPDRRAERGPFGAGGLKQDHFVFRKEDEIAVRICSEIALGCRLAKSSERFQSSLVIVLKSGSGGCVREEGAADARGLSGEGILHVSAMGETSGAAHLNATTVCRQVIRTARLRPRACPRRPAAPGPSPPACRPCAGPSRPPRTSSRPTRSGPRRPGCGRAA